MNEILPVKVSAALVVYKEEQVIRRCLESIRQVVDELIVVHDGDPLDRTMDIASEYTDKLFVQPRVGEAEPLRVFSFEQCTGDWILQIDADEYLSDDLKDSLRSLLTDDAINGYAFLWKQWDGERYFTHSGPYKPALFRKETMHYIGVPHFQVWVDGVMKKSDLHLEHKPLYNNFSFRAFREKRLRFAKVQAIYLGKDIQNVPTFQVTDKAWPNRFKFKIQYPYVALFVMPVVNFINVLKDSRSQLSVLQLKRAISEGVYVFMVYLHLTYIKLSNRVKYRRYDNGSQKVNNHISS